MVSSNEFQLSHVAHSSPVSRSPLAHTLDALRGSLGRFRATFDGARVRRSELGCFASPESVVVALDSSSPLSQEARYALVASLVREHASHPSGPALWSSLLLVAFRPLLLRARARLGRPEDTEYDARVLAAFLDALGRQRSVHVDRYAAVALQRGTLKALARDRMLDREAAADAAFDEEVHTVCEPHALTLGDALADEAWSDARASKLAAFARLRPRHARAHSDFSFASLLPPRTVQPTASMGISP